MIIECTEVERVSGRTKYLLRGAETVPLGLLTETVLTQIVSKYTISASPKILSRNEQRNSVIISLPTGVGETVRASLLREIETRVRGA